MTWKLLCGALFTSALAFACTDPTGTASAAVSDPTAASAGSGQRPPPKPPQQALDACAKSAAGDACAFDIDGHHVTGTCSHGPDGNGPLACKPDQPPPPPKPPQAALDACANKADGDACTVTCDNGDTIVGTCTTPPDGSAIVCAPDGPPPPQ